jgi:uncharacterized membrane protein YadS
MNFFWKDGKCMPGIELAAKRLLRLGVPLLGLRITLRQIATLAWLPGVLVVGWMLARVAGFKSSFGVLTGGGGYLRCFGRAGHFYHAAESSAA